MFYQFEYKFNMIVETLEFARGSLKFWETLAEYRWTEVLAIHVHDFSEFCSTSLQSIVLLYIYLFYDHRRELRSNQESVHH